KGQIDVQDIGERGATVAESQTDSDIFQHALRLRAQRVASHDAAHVEEHRAADIEQLERKPVAVHALLGGEEPSTRASLIAQWIAPQTVVSSEQYLRVGVEVASGSCRKTHEEQSPL